MSVAFSAGCASSSGEALPLLRLAVQAHTVRVLLENLTAEDAAAVDPQQVCDDTLEAQGMWFDALRLLDMQEALRAYSRCGLGVNLDLIEATKLPLTPARQSRIERYIETWKEVSVRPDSIFESRSAEPSTSPDYATIDVLMALQAAGTSDALKLCQRLGAKASYRCGNDLLTGSRVFDTPERAVANDPFLVLYEPRLSATSRDGLRRFYVLETLKRPHDDTCRPVAVLTSEAGSWSIERVECETTSNIAEDLSAQELRPNTNLCEIASDPERFIGKRVVVDGCITSDGQEYTALTQHEGHCDAGGLSPGKSPDYRPAEWFYPKPDEKACGTFAGVFRGSDTLNPRVLEIDDAQNVRIVPLKR